MIETAIRGDINELQCILDFQKRGYYCSIPFSGSCRYDVVADIGGHLYRIQCKAASYKEDEGVLSIKTAHQTTNTKGTTRYQYTKEEVDYFYTSWNNYSFLIPLNEVSTQKYLRVKKPKNQGIQEQMSIASDYLFDNVVDSIVNNIPIKKYRDNMIISIENGIEKTWTIEELNNHFNERQIRYIKECINKNKMAYQKEWKYKEFPVL